MDVWCHSLGDVYIYVIINYHIVNHYNPLLLYYVLLLFLAPTYTSVIELLLPTYRTFWLTFKKLIAYIFDLLII